MQASHACVCSSTFLVTGFIGGSRTKKEGCRFGVRGSARVSHQQGRGIQAE